MKKTARWLRHQISQTNRPAKQGLFFLSLLLFSAATFAQETIEVSGRVTDQENKEPLPGVAVSIKGTVAGTVTGNTGDFVLRARQKLPFTLVFTSVGFAPQEVLVSSIGSKLQVALATQTVLGNEVVVTASRVPENILRSPVAIEKLDIRAIRETSTLR